MNCHEDKQGNQEKGHKGHGSHMWLMVLCCAIPIVLWLLLPTLQISNSFLARVFPYAIFLLCPLLHLLMMPMMLGKKKDRDVMKKEAIQIEHNEEGL